MSFDGYEGNMAAIVLRRFRIFIILAAINIILSNPAAERCAWRIARPDSNVSKNKSLIFMGFHLSWGVGNHQNNHKQNTLFQPKIKKKKRLNATRRSNTLMETLEGTR